MATYTPNYGLHQWVPEDNFLRTDFNQDLSKIDAALMKKSEIVVGTFVGDGQPEQTIELGFTPLALLVENEEGQRGAEGYYRFGGLILPNQPHKVGRIVTGGFSVYYSYETIKILLNSNQIRCYYLALRPAGS